MTPKEWIDKEPSEEWHDYNRKDSNGQANSKWANIYFEKDGRDVYYVWIPRYEFMLTSSQQAQPEQGRAEVRFIQGTSTETDEGYEIPQEFTIDGEEVTGYWKAEKVIGEETAPLFDTEVVATSSSIRTKGILGTKVGENQKYKYFLDGEYQYEYENAEIEHEYKGLEANKQYTIYVEIRTVDTNVYLGSISKQIKTIDPNRPELIGFNINEGTDVNGSATNMPNGWYDYSKSKWANIVVTDGDIVEGQIENATKTIYYVWIPRYEFMLTSIQLENKRKLKN